MKTESEIFCRGVLLEKAPACVSLLENYGGEMLGKYNFFKVQNIKNTKEFMDILEESGNSHLKEDSYKEYYFIMESRAKGWEGSVLFKKFCEKIKYESQ